MIFANKIPKETTELCPTFILSEVKHLNFRSFSSYGEIYEGTFRKRLKLSFGGHYLLKVIMFVSIFASSNAFTQSAMEIQYAYASKLFKEEKYFDAITEFKRLQFFDSLKLYSFSSNKTIGLSYKQGGKFNEAIRYFSAAEMNTADLDSVFYIKIEIIKANLLRRTIFHAFGLLEDLSKDMRFVDKKDQIIYWKGWAYIFNDDWVEASKEFYKLNSNHELGLLCKNVSESQLSQTKARILSYILPGAGQFYSGNYLSGLMSLGWVTLWTYMATEAFVSERIFDGFMVSNFLAFRFYNGNVQNAEKFVNQHNIEVGNWMLNYLKNNYLGPKP